MRLGKNKLRKKKTQSIELTRQTRNFFSWDWDNSIKIKSNIEGWIWKKKGIDWKKNKGEKKNKALFQWIVFCEEKYSKIP
jgi:hypothetical protein